MDRTSPQAAMSRRGFLAGLLAAASAGAAGPGPKRLVTGEAPALTKRPNFLFLFSDDQRFDTIHALGNAEIQTPVLDSLVARGTAFTHHYIQGGVHGAICVCSRAILMTGQSLWHAMATIDKAPLLPEVLAKAGYETFITGKWHNSPASCARAFTSGADIFLGGMANHDKVPVHDFDPSGKFPKSGQRTAPKFSSEDFSDAAIAFLKNRKAGEKPFFAYVSYTAPHDPRMAPKEYAGLYPPEKIKLPPNFMPAHPFDNGELKVRDEKLAPFPRTEAAVRQHIAAYYAMITHLDAQIGRVLQVLKETGHAEDTIIVFNGDNGLAVGRHGLMGKQNLYDHSVRTPLIIAGPGIPAGKRCDALVCQHDLFPTLCWPAGVDVPASVEGKSLLPLISGSQPAVHDSVFAAYRDVQRMVRVGNYKLIEYPKVRRTQLFDLSADPDEMKDLSAQADQAERVNQLRARLLEWQKKTDDPMLRSPSSLQDKR